MTEYLVVCIADEQLRWFDLRSNKELSLASDGIIRVESFPGLWVDTTAVFAKDFNRLIRVLQEGLTTEEHAQFVRRLARKQ